MRNKSGFALRFPRFTALRIDKPLSETVDLKDIEKSLKIKSAKIYGISSMAMNYSKAVNIAKMIKSFSETKLFL